MLKRIISILLICAVLAQFSSVGAQEVTGTDTNVVLNEVFDDYAVNSVPKLLSIKGINARIVEHSTDNHSLYGKVWGSPVRFGIPVNNIEDNAVFSFDIKISGDKIKGEVLSFNSSNPFLSFTKTGGIILEDGYRISGYGDGKWHNFSVAVDFKNGKYNLYRDKTLIIKSRSFYNSAAKPAEISMEFMPLSNYTEADVYVDNVRVYSGSTLLPDGAFEKKEINRQIDEYELVTERIISDKVYINSSGRTGLDNLKLVSKGESTASWSELHGNGEYIRFYQQKETQDCFADLTFDIEDTNYLIYQTDLYISSLETSDIIVGRMRGDTYSSVLVVKPGGILTAGGRAIGSVPLNTWLTLAIVCDYINATGDVYVNGSCVYDDHPLHNGGVIPVKGIRIGLTTASSLGKNEVYFNNIKVYDGVSFRSFDDAAIDNASSNQASGQSKFVSIHDDEEDAKTLLESDVAFMANNDTFFAQGEKQRYSDNGAEVYADENGILMVPSHLLAEALGTDITVNGNTVTAAGKTAAAGSPLADDGSELSAPPAAKEGTMYLPAASFANKILGKYVYEDERGFVLISDKTRNYSNSDNIKTNLEDIDIIYRYLQFERPSGEKLYSDFLENSGEARPRLFIKKDEVALLRQKVDKSPQVKTVFGELLTACDKYLVSKPTEYVIPDGLRLFTSCEKVKHILMDLGVAYLITDDVKYADRMWTELENCLSWKDWNIKNHFLDSGEIGPGIAFAYDVLSDYLTDEQKAFIRTKTTGLYLDYAVGVFTGESAYTAFDGRQTGSNWGAVNSTSMLLCALSFMGDEPYDSPLMEKCRFIAKNALQSLEYPIGSMFPDGNVNEGLGYWEYYVEHLSWSINALVNMCGSDYSLLSAPGYREAADTAMYLQTVNGVFNYGAMGTTGTISPPEMFLISKFYNNSALMQLAEANRKNIKASADAACWILWYEPSDETVDLNSYPLDKYFTGQRITAMRSGWNADSAYVGIVGGFNAEDGAQFDKGSFIFEQSGVRWLEDMGKGNQNVEGGYYGKDGWTLYIKRTEGHNSLVINPAAPDPGQLPYGEADNIRMESKPKGAITVMNLSEVYADEVTSYTRGFMLGEDRETLVVQDEAELIKPGSELYYSFHTYGTVTLNADGKSAVITRNGKQLKVEFISDAAEWHLETSKADAMFPENVRSNEYSREGINKLVFKGKASGKLNISVKFTPVDGWQYEEHKLIPISEWSIPDGVAKAKPQLDKLFLNGAEVGSFSSTQKEITLDWEGKNGLPVIEAYSSSGTVSVEQARAMGDPATVTVVTPEGRKAVYKINFNIIISTIRSIIKGAPSVGLPDDVELLPAAAIYSDDNPQAANQDINAADGSFDTRWSSDKEGAYLEVDLGASYELSGIASAFMSGNSRYYKYDILVSEDKVNYTTIYEGTSTGKTSEWEYFPANVKARYVRLIGYGHADGEWNSVTEFRPCIKKQ